MDVASLRAMIILIRLLNRDYRLAGNTHSVPCCAVHYKDRRPETYTTILSYSYPLYQLGTGGHTQKAEPVRSVYCCAL